MPQVKQASFAAGEISPSLYGRSDLAQHGHALRLCRNMIVKPSGAVTNRPGTHFVAETKDDNTARLLPFDFSSAQTFVLEFGHEYLRFYHDGAAVTIAAILPLDGWSSGTTYSPGAFVAYAGKSYRACWRAEGADPNLNKNPATETSWWREQVDTILELDTPYQATELAKLKYAQCGDVITLVHPAQVPYELKRVTNAEWELEPLDFTPPSPWFGDENPRLKPQTLAPGPALGPCNMFVAGDLEQRRRWQWCLTSLCQDQKGRTWETMPFVVERVLLPPYPPWDAAIYYCSPDVPEWSAATIYGQDVGVVFEAQCYRSLVAQNCGNVPKDTPAQWALCFSYAQDPDTGEWWEWLVNGNLALAGYDPADPNSASMWEHHAANETMPRYDALPLEICPQGFVVTKDQALVVDWTAEGAQTPPADYRVLSWQVYRGVAGMWGWVGEVGYGEATKFVDMGEPPDYTRQPPKGTNPFAVYDSDGELVRTENPSAVCFHDQRRVFANTYDPTSGEGGRPATIFGSRVGDYANFDHKDLATDADAVEFELAARRYEEIRSLLSMDRLIAFSSGSEWSVGGAGESPMSRSSISARPQSQAGASWLDALLVGNAALYVQERGPRVRELLFSADIAAYGGRDLSLLASHLLDGGRSIVDWAHAAVPFDVVWMVRDDGLLLGLTYLREQEVCAWHWHDTEGAFEAVCVVQEEASSSRVVEAGSWNPSHGPNVGGTLTSTVREDAVYVVVRRTIAGVTRRYIERMATRQVTDDRKGVFLDCARSWDTRNTGNRTLKILSATDKWVAGTAVTIETATAYFDSGWVGKTVVFGATAGGEGTSVLVTSETSTTVLAGTLVEDAPEALQGEYTTDWARAPATILLEALEEEEVSALADGVAVDSITVATGGLTTLPPSAIGCIGLPYTPEIEPLDLAEARTKQKTVTRVWFEVEASGGLSAGETADHLTRWTPKKIAGAHGGTTDLVQVPIAHSWNKGGRAVLRQTEPLPLTVLSVIREVQVGGD